MNESKPPLAPAYWYFYERALGRPFSLLLLSMLFAVLAMSGLRYFEFDASSDTLVVEGDPALLRYNEMSALFGGDDFVVLTYTSENVITRRSLQEIAALQNKLTNLDGVAKTYSILDVPLLRSPPVPLQDIATQTNSLRHEAVDLELARRELLSHPLLSNYLISKDGTTTAISITLERDADLMALQQVLDRQIQTRARDNTTYNAYQIRKARYVSERQQTLDQLRKIRHEYTGSAELFISGVPMIAADMLSYVRFDLERFSILVVLLITILLTFFFRSIRWVLIPLGVCFVTIGTTIGALGYLGKPVTVVSSNFISLLAIISISFSIHLIVRFRESLTIRNLSHHRRVMTTMQSKFAPCFYTALTTILAFGSMVGSDIVPIVDFGWMMCLGIVIAFITTYTIFPATLLLLGEAPPSKTLGQKIALARWFHRLATEHTNTVVATSMLLSLIGFYGVTLTSFDNKFIDYFHAHTDIHEGMRQVDEHLGGTMPLDIYIKFERFQLDEDDLFLGFEETYPARYWFTPDKINLIRQVQSRLNALPEIGKVLSIASLEETAQSFNDNSPLNGLQIAFLLGELPQPILEFFVTPYANPEAGWMRLNARIIESSMVVPKRVIIEDINHYLTHELALREDEFVVTGMAVLFNDMLQQLASSQIRTSLYVILATFFMFSVLLRSLKLAALALAPNILAALLIVAFMGYAEIPMDMMTVTIAAICIGIGVDDAIHYLHRYRKEYATSNSVPTAIDLAHQTIGRAMYFTTITVMGGFSILTFSNFVPTIYFGLLTVLAMALALLANMILLPALLMLFSGNNSNTH